MDRYVCLWIAMLASGVRGDTQISQWKGKDKVVLLHLSSVHHCNNLCLYTTLCKNGGSCEYNYTSCQPYCICADGYHGRRCEHPAKTAEEREAPSDTTSSGVMRTVMRTVMRRVMRDGAYVDGERNVTCRVVTREANQCPQGFPCKHGACVTEETEAGALRYTCACDPGWTAYFCDVCCDLDCGTNGSCILEENGTKRCQCSWGWQGRHCNETASFLPLDGVANNISVNWIVLGLCAVLALALGVATVLVPYIAWKKRFLVIWKLLYWLQPFEDDIDDSRFLYHAFISYKASEQDEKFVVHTLMPKLEKEMNFKLCLHFRDFIVGAPIANNIIHSVEKSRRTILLLSPDYIQQDKWTRFEYQVAQNEMLEMKHRIVPIILRDISHITDMDPNLKFLVQSTTYIEWPGTENPKKEAEFWDRLRLSLPKIRNPKESIKPEASNISLISHRKWESTTPSTLPTGTEEMAPMVSVKTVSVPSS